MTRSTLPLVFATALALALFVGCSKKDDNKGHGHGNKAKVGGAKVTANPDNKGPKIPIEVNRKGYKPDRVEAKAGDAVLVFTRTEDVPCGKYVKVDGLDGKTELPLNKPVEVGVHLPKSGEVRFACGMDMLTGVVAVK